MINKGWNEDGCTYGGVGGVCKIESGDRKDGCIGIGEAVVAVKARGG